MSKTALILNEREAREARSSIDEFDRILKTEEAFQSIIAGLPAQVTNSVRKAVKSHRDELEALFLAYERAKGGDYKDLQHRAGNDPGLALVVARIARQLTQKELARKLGLKEQQVQRYEADRYSTISISNFQRIASVLGVELKLNLSSWGGGGWSVAQQISAVEVKKILRHARENKWFSSTEDNSSDSEGEESFNYLQRYVSNHIVKYGSPSLLRTGLNVVDHSDDFSLLAWKARVMRRAEEVIAKNNVEHRPLDIRWLVDLVRLSTEKDSPARARDLLLTKGIVLIAELPIPGMKVDGAAFRIGSVPVIGMTLRRDTLDNFWFTLLHEVAHVILHYRTGLAIGFFDDTDSTDIDGIENEANEFASNLLIADEIWRKSPARISKSSDVIERFAKDIKVHPAIVFGRIQKERKSYAVFTDKIGRGQVRKFLIE